jgi:hypothetical protein
MWDEDVLLEQVRTAVRQAGTPTPAMIAAGESAFCWGMIDAELVALTHDSLVHESVLVRSGDVGPRSLVFEGAQLSLEIEETENCLVGQLLPPTSGVVALLNPNAEEHAHAVIDELGCFRFESSVVGPVRLRFRTASHDLLTDWFRL